MPAPNIPVAITMPRSPLRRPIRESGQECCDRSPVRNPPGKYNNVVIGRTRSKLENNSESYPALPLRAIQNPQIAIDLLADLAGSHYPGRHHELT
jgi:hypothetical protein